jgi:hypothetical protein
MADSGIISGVSSMILPNLKDNHSEYTCAKCFTYEYQLKEALEELESAQLIINILQTALINSTTKNTSTNYLVTIQGPKDLVETEKWTLVSSKNHSGKPNSNHNQNQTQPTPTSNQFHPLHNLQDTHMKARQASNSIPKPHKNPKRTLKRKTVNKTIRHKPTKKIILIGDSHIRGLASESNTRIGKENSISSNLMPGARLQSITNLARNEIET